MTTYTIQIKHIKKGWQDKTTIALFDPAKQAEIEQEIKDEMRSYGAIAIRCKVERDDQATSYIFAS
jgi:hypothetical protein